MTFEEIFSKDGLYVADSFAKGVAIHIKEHTLYFVEYKSKDDLLPIILNVPIYKGLFEKEYKKILNINQLF